MSSGRPPREGRGRRDPVPHAWEQARQPRTSTRPVPAAQAGLGSAPPCGGGRGRRRHKPIDRPPDRRPDSRPPRMCGALCEQGRNADEFGWCSSRGVRGAAAPIGGGGLGGAAHRDERDRCLGGPAARPGGRVREPRGRTRRAGRPPARRAPAVPRGRVVRARANALSSSGPAAHRGSRRLAPAAARHATLPAPSSPSIAAGQRASGRPRCDSVAVVLPNWSRGGRSAPGGRFTRPQRAGRAARARDRS